MLFVVIGQPDLAELAAREPDSEDQMYQTAAAQEVMYRREVLLARLRERGVLALESESSVLSPDRRQRVPRGERAESVIGPWALALGVGPWEAGLKARPTVVARVVAVVARVFRLANRVRPSWRGSFCCGESPCCCGADPCCCGAGLQTRGRRPVVSIRVVRLGTARLPDEGLRIGTVRRPPRGVPKSEYAAKDWFDVWFPNLAPTLETMKLGQASASPAGWATFVRKYKTEMSIPDARHDLELLAAMSHVTNLSVGCYCEDESHCHRSILKQLLIDHGAEIE